jgi:hypothetical protein
MEKRIPFLQVSIQISTSSPSTVALAILAYISGRVTVGNAMLFVCPRGTAISLFRPVNNLNI